MLLAFFKRSGHYDRQYYPPYYPDDDCEGQQRLEEVLVDAFENAGATEHGSPQFIWSQGETMAAFRAEAQVHALAPLTNMKRVERWRVVERFELIGATERTPNLPIYITHQPSSKGRPFKSTQINLYKAVLRDAIRHCGENKDIVGYGFGGDAKYSIGA